MNKLRNELRHLILNIELEIDLLQMNKDIKPFKENMEIILDNLNEIETELWFKELEEDLNETKKENE